MAGVEEGLGISVCWQRGWQSRVAARKASIGRTGEAGCSAVTAALSCEPSEVPLEIVRGSHALRAARQIALHIRYSLLRLREEGGVKRVASHRACLQ